MSEVICAEVFPKWWSIPRPRGSMSARRASGGGDRLRGASGRRRYVSGALRIPPGVAEEGAGRLVVGSGLRC
ncbi:MAG: hypothetical protein WAK07_20070, partial [Rhodomicrobium sp.]